MNTQENNKLIAEFMGFMNTTPTDKDFNIMEHPDTGEMQEPMSMKYHNSWDWLMPVVEKVSKSSQYGDILDDVLGIEWMHGCVHVNIDISTTYKAVVEFIKWYNKQQNK